VNRHGNHAKELEKKMNSRSSLLPALIAALGAVMVASLVIRSYMRSRPVAYMPFTCISNIKQAGLGLVMYAGDENDRLPPAKNWMDRVYPYTKNDFTFRCPLAVKASPAAYGYAFKRSLSQAKTTLKDPEKAPMAFDTDLLSKNAVTDVLPSFEFDRHNHPNICFVDGHAKMLQAPIK
jgi:prepilin-type processing-associated H-X9-DG protein